MTDDLDRRLRESAQMTRDDVFQAEPDLLDEAADEIARLRAENEALREAVRIALACTPSARNGEVIYDCGNPWEILSAALKGSLHE